MVFTSESFLVRLFADKVNDKSITIDDVPVLYNLKDEVVKLIV